MTTVPYPTYISLLQALQTTYIMDLTRMRIERWLSRSRHNINFITNIAGACLVYAGVKLLVCGESNEALSI